MGNRKHSSLWFQFFSLKILSNNNLDFGVSMYMTGEKVMGASIHDRQRHADCIWISGSEPRTRFNFHSVIYQCRLFQKVSALYNGH